jgi:ABC-type transport system involved in multi-copper enzyme maturation permease subunit
MGVGVVVQAHLAALFISSLSMGAAMLVAMFWSAGAVYLPLLAMLETFRFDVTAVGITPSDGLDAGPAVLVSAGWVLLVLGAGALSFLRRDVT